MKNLCIKYSYAITLIILSCSLALFLSFRDHSTNDNQYLKITVSDGDSLWKISNKYAEQHSLSPSEFVGWVQKHNKNISDEIYPGEKIVIPVSVVSKKTSATTSELASAPEE